MTGSDCLVGPRWIELNARPRARGDRPENQRAPGLGDISFPAHAGIDPVIEQPSPLRKRRPRARGDQPAGRYGVNAAAVTAPHAGINLGAPPSKANSSTTTAPHARGSTRTRTTGLGGPSKPRTSGDLPTSWIAVDAYATLCGTDGARRSDLLSGATRTRGDRAGTLGESNGRRRGPQAAPATPRRPLPRPAAPQGDTGASNR